jgi:signal transduction histidine kinase/CheY-like chemotaxis protein
MHAIVHRGESSPDHAWCDCPMRAALLAAKRSASDHDVILRKDGSSFFADYTISPIVAMNGAIAGGVVTFRDISERRAVERMKDEFVSIVSHELRTPLTSIRGALGLLAGGRLGEVSPKAARMLDIAVSNTDRLVRLINDILDMERMESGQVTLNRQLCDIDDAMSQAIEAIRPMADKAGVLLECKPWPGVVLADPDRLAQTFANLLSNAIKFSPAGSTVTLSATDVPGFVEFEVADRGRGIPADKLELIFERFQQVDASDSREKGGSGLGLPICRSIVRQHGGEIRAESTPGSGSRFRFTIPRSDKPVIEAVSIGKTVVICDDEISIRSVVTALLEQRGYHAVPIGSGPELLRRIGAIAPDAVILDLLMPGLNGCETLARLKEDPRTAGIPVIIMSVFSAEDSAWPVDDLAGWIQKPIDERTIVDALERAFRLSLDASHVA